MSPERTSDQHAPQGKHLRYDAKQESHGTMCYYKASEQDCQTCPAKDQCCPRTRHGRSIERRELLPDIAAFRQKMQTDETKAIYKTRSQVAEFPNLWIKAKFGLSLACAELPKYALNLSGSPSPTISCSGFASAGGQRWYRRSRRRERIEHTQPDSFKH